MGPAGAPWQWACRRGPATGPQLRHFLHEVWVAHGRPAGRKGTEGVCERGGQSAHQGTWLGAVSPPHAACPWPHIMDPICACIAGLDITSSICFILAAICTVQAQPGRCEEQPTTLVRCAAEGRRRTGELVGIEINVCQACSMTPWPLHHAQPAHSHPCTQAPLGLTAPAPSPP